MGFFTDTSVCIGCKACEVACKEWNEVPAQDDGFSAMSFDNTRDLGANSWRHVAFIEQRRPLGVEDSPAASLVQEAAAQDLAASDGVPVPRTPACAG